MMSEKDVEFPSIEYEECYPEDEEFTAWQGVPFSFKAAREWLLDELPKAAEHMPCLCEIGDGFDIMDKPCKLISFSTGGWSGAESIIGLIERRPDLNCHMLSWKRGGHYVFEIPTERIG